jgi:chaperonin GroES
MLDQNQQPLPVSPEMAAPDPQAVMQQLTELEQSETAAHASENYNLCEGEALQDEGLRREIGQEVWRGFDDDDGTRKDWLDRHAFWLSLYMQQDYAENSDPERSWGATESLPILTESCDQFQSRTYKTFFPQDSFVSAQPMRKRKEDRDMLEERAKRIGDHMSYQLGFKDRNFKQDKDALFLGVAVHGSFFTKTYPKLVYNNGIVLPKIDNVRPTDLAVSYNVGPARIEDLRRKSHIIYTTVGETQDLVNKGYFIAPAKPALQEQGKNPYNVRVDESQGLAAPSATSIKRDAPAVLIEQHFYLDLDGSGDYRPYIATICAAGRHLMRLSIGYEADPMGTPLKDYEQIQYFTHYKFKNNPDGFYGLGLGHTIGELNSAANIMLRQTMDAATLANDGNMSGFISERLGLDSDEIRMVIGKFIKIPDTVGDLQNSIMQMQFRGPNDALIKLMEAIDVRAQRLGSTTEATTGTPSRQEQPTTYLAAIEQALETFSSVQQRLAASLGDELQKVFRINQRYLPLVDNYIVNGDPEQITRADYADDMLIQPIFDPKFASQAQKVARAKAELDGTLQNPVNQSRPAVIDAAFKRYFEALDVNNIDELIPPEPQIENFDDQIVENMFFLMPKEARPLFDVFPDQNHAQHLAELQQFTAQYGQMLQPDQQMDILKHQQKHMAYFYGQQNGIVPPPGQEPTPPLAARSDNPVDPGSAIAAVPPAQAAGLADFVGQPLPMGIGGAPNGAGAGIGGNQPPV